MRGLPRGGTASGTAARVLVRCDAGHATGMGHLVRCLAIARHLRDSHACGVTFAMGASAVGEARLARAGFPVVRIRERCEEGDMDALLERLEPGAMVLDIRTPLPGRAVQRWREQGVVTVLIDDGSPRRLQADLAFFPPVPQLERMGWQGFTGELLAGWEWVVLREELSRPARRGSRRVPRVLVTMGGSDPRNLTALAVQALDPLAGRLDPVLVTGAAYRHEDELAALLACCRSRFETRCDVDDLSAEMAEADLAVTSFGMTAWELAAMGVPALYLCLSADHEESARTLVDAGAGVVAGRAGRVEPGDLSQRIEEALADLPRRQRRARQLRRRLDGGGARRVAQRIARRMEKRRA